MQDTAVCDSPRCKEFMVCLMSTACITGIIYAGIFTDLLV